MNRIIDVFAFAFPSSKIPPLSSRSVTVGWGWADSEDADDALEASDEMDAADDATGICPWRTIGLQAASVMQIQPRMKKLFEDMVGL